MYRAMLLMMAIFVSTGCASNMSAKYVVGGESRIIELPPQQLNESPLDPQEIGFEDVFLTEKVNKSKGDSLTNAAVVATSTDDYIKNGTADIIVQPDNTRLYPYGLSQPKLTCAKMLFCIVELQPGERVLDLAAGDTVRWQTKVSYKGDPGNFTAMIMVKPFMGSLTTNLSIVTDRRDYNIIMTSIDSGEYMPRVGFYYPQDTAPGAKLPVPPELKKERKDPLNIDIEHVHFDYSLDGDKRLSWYPVSVFDDGRKVYIKMGDRAAQSELPVFHVLDKSGQPQVVNYRYLKPYFIVDMLFDRGELVLGSDKSQTKILVRRK